jgi:two-component system, NtrC family, nitrogen regulation response regulator GlnG
MVDDKKIHIEPTAAVVTGKTGQAKAGCILYVVDGVDEDVGKSLRLATGEASVGQSQSCEIMLTDSSVSQQHVQVTIHTEGVRIRDLESTNGTYYLGNAIKEIILDKGGRLKLGRTMIDVIPLASSTIAQPYLEDKYGNLVGASGGMRRLFGYLKKLEKTNAPILIQGETGTGKELIAQAVHDRSDRCANPYVVVDCGTLAKELAASELFGHVKGAFTGASADRRGAFEKGHKGTVFLDEIGELPLDVQAHLLRVLESGQVKPVGDSNYRRVDVRIVAATHRDLQGFVKQGDFREDLYFRLSVFQVKVPALRERLEDLDLLSATLARRLGLPEEKLPAAAQSAFMRHSWPGNIRELRNALQRFHVLNELPGVNVCDDLGGSLSAKEVESTGQFHLEKQRVVMNFEKAFLEQVWSRCQNISEAARDTGLSRRQLRDLLRKYGLYE